MRDVDLAHSVTRQAGVGAALGVRVLAGVHAEGFAAVAGTQEVVEPGIK